MTFKNEFVPPLEQETSEFFKKAREILHVGHTNYDRWTVDRESEIAFKHERSGREVETADHGIWSYINKNGRCVFSTERISKTEVTPGEVMIKYRLNEFWAGQDYATPDGTTLIGIKEALREYGKWHLFNPEAFKLIHIILIDGRTGAEV